MLRPHLLGPNAIGIEVDGKVYTTDLPFWLSLVKSGGRFKVVYDTSDTLLGRFQAFIKDKLPRTNGPYLKLPSDTILEFQNLHKWEQLKKAEHWRWCYGYVSEDHGWEPHGEEVASDEENTTPVSLTDPPPPYSREPVP